VISLFFPDPVLNRAMFDQPEDSKKGTGILCSHCHTEIKGRVHQYGNQYFDSYCWNLRFILKMGDEEEQRKDELKRFLANRAVESGERN
jgi:hypothetical protein